MSDVEQKAHDLAVALASSYATGKYVDEAARLSEYGLEFDVSDCEAFFKNYSTMYEQFKEMLISNSN